MPTIKPIGVIHSPLKKLEDCPRQESENAPEAWVEIFDEYADAAADIVAEDEIILLTWLDKADRSVRKTHPRNDPDTALTGVFSTRSPDRPNPIGLHLLTVLSVQGKNRFKVSALEVLDGTPVIDVKSGSN